MPTYTPHIFTRHGASKLVTSSAAETAALAAGWKKGEAADPNAGQSALAVPADAAQATDVEVAAAVAGVVAGGMRVVNAGGVAGTARPSGVGAVYWKCNAGVTPTNAVAGDLIFNASS